MLVRAAGLKNDDRHNRTQRNASGRERLPRTRTFVHASDKKFKLACQTDEVLPSGSDWSEAGTGHKHTVKRTGKKHTNDNIVTTWPAYIRPHITSRSDTDLICNKPLLSQNVCGTTRTNAVICSATHAVSISQARRKFRCRRIRVCKLDGPAMVSC